MITYPEFLDVILVANDKKHKDVKKNEKGNFSATILGIIIWIFVTFQKSYHSPQVKGYLI